MSVRSGIHFERSKYYSCFFLIIRNYSIQSEPSIRGTIITITTMAFNLGIFTVLALGAILPWRRVAFICAIFPICCFIAVLFVSVQPVHQFFQKIFCIPDSFLGSRVAILAVIQRPFKRRAKIIAMASWLGLTTNHPRRIH